VFYRILTARPNKAGFFIVIGVINYNKKNVTKTEKKSADLFGG
jgi:hypothetical protein